MQQTVKIIQNYLVESRFGLVIIDDLIGSFRSSPDYQGLEHLAMRQNEVRQVLWRLHVASVFGINFKR